MMSERLLDSRANTEANCGLQWIWSTPVIAPVKLKVRKEPWPMTDSTETLEKAESPRWLREGLKANVIRAASLGTRWRSRPAQAGRLSHRQQGGNSRVSGQMTPTL